VAQPGTTAAPAFLSEAPSPALGHLWQCHKLVAAHLSLALAGLLGSSFCLGCDLLIWQLADSCAELVMVLAAPMSPMPLPSLSNPLSSRVQLTSPTELSRSDVSYWPWLPLQTALAHLESPPRAKHHGSVQMLTIPAVTLVEERWLP
jgi:hypothetical protein